MKFNFLIFIFLLTACKKDRQQYQVKCNNPTNNIDTSLQVTHLGGESFKTSDDYWLHGRFILSMINFFHKNYTGFKTNILKSLVLSNSYLILFMEKINTFLGKEDEFRIRKHKYLLSEFYKTY